MYPNHITTSPIELVKQREALDTETRNKTAELLQSASEKGDEARTEQGNKLHLEDVLQVRVHFEWSRD